MTQSTAATGIMSCEPTQVSLWNESDFFCRGRKLPPHLPESVFQYLHSDFYTINIRDPIEFGASFHWEAEDSPAVPCI